MKHEYILRFVAVSAALGSLVLVTLAVAMFPTYISLRVREDVSKNDLQTAKESSVAKDKNILLKTLKDLEGKMKEVSLVSNENATDFIDKAVQLKNTGIKINSISYTKKGDKKDIVIEGVARTRNDLIDFSKEAKNSLWTVSSDIPISSFSSDHDIAFSITLTTTSTSQ
ncbi:MAG: hypothetical protein WCO12_03030 [bacterium]